VLLVFLEVAVATHFEGEFGEGYPSGIDVVLGEVLLEPHVLFLLGEEGA
jgi:hypothetical protein